MGKGKFETRQTLVGVIDAVAAQTVCRAKQSQTAWRLGRKEKGNLLFERDALKMVPEPVLHYQHQGTRSDEKRGKKRKRKIARKKVPRRRRVLTPV